jgi:competence protein ComEC
MVSAYLIPDVEVLKVGHHGSRTASSRQFMEAARPEVAILTLSTPLKAINSSTSK